MQYTGFFSKAPGGDEARAIRRFETIDIVRRRGVISPKRLYINNYPVGNPIAAFNTSVAVEDGEVLFYTRVIVGYYKYVSAVAEIRALYDDIETGDVSINYYAGRIVVYPSTRYDIWGAEDPRVYTLDGKLYMTYTGRTSFYFTQTRRERTLPVTAIRDEEGHWRKRFVMVMPPGLREHVVTDKNAFLVKAGSEHLFFHRLHMDDETFYLVASRVKKKELEEAEKLSRENGGPAEVILGDTTWVMMHAKFEKKLGWATPPLHLGGGRMIAFIHGVDAEMEAYRLAALLLEYSSSEGLVVKAVTPTYIMEPRTLYEVYGDRPYTVFPCGLWRLDKRRLLLTYGAADYMTGIGVINLDELMAQLEKGVIH